MSNFNRFYFSKFPEELDNDKTLFKVYNNSESILEEIIDDMTTNIKIKPREWNENEIWSDESGIININGELIYYGDVIYENNINNNDKRIIGFTNIIRGVDGTKIENHEINESVRGYVLAQHHNILASAIMGIEKLIGINNSDDINSLDYQINTIINSNLEEDDFGAPTAYFWGNELDDGGIKFNINIQGAYEKFQFEAKDGLIFTNELNPVIAKEDNNNLNPKLKIFSSNSIFEIYDSGLPQFDVDEIEDDGTILNLPDIQIPPIPTLSLPTLSCDFCKPIIPNVEFADQLVAQLELSQLSGQSGSVNNLTDIGPSVLQNVDYSNLFSSGSTPSNSNNIGLSGANSINRFSSSLDYGAPQGDNNKAITFGDINVGNPSIGDVNLELSNLQVTPEIQIGDIQVGAPEVNLGGIQIESQSETFETNAALKNFSDLITPILEKVISIPETMTVNVPPIEVTGITNIGVDVNVAIDWATTVDEEGNEETSPCFRMVPCSE